MAPPPTNGELTLPLSGEATSGVEAPVPPFLSFFCCFFFSALDGAESGLPLALDGVKGAGGGVETAGFAGVLVPFVGGPVVARLGKLDVAEVGVPPTVAVRR